MVNVNRNLNYNTGDKHIIKYMKEGEFVSFATLKEANNFRYKVWYHGRKPARAKFGTNEYRVYIVK